MIIIAGSTWIINPQKWIFGSGNHIALTAVSSDNDSNTDNHEREISLINTSKETNFIK